MILFSYKKNKMNFNTYTANLDKANKYFYKMGKKLDALNYEINSIYRAINYDGDLIYKSKADKIKKKVYSLKEELQTIKYILKYENILKKLKDTLSPHEYLEKQLLRHAEHLYDSLKIKINPAIINLEKIEDQIDSGQIIDQYGSIYETVGKKNYKYKHKRKEQKYPSRRQYSDAEIFEQLMFAALSERY